MKVVLKPTILDAIYERLDDAKRRNREVAHILVTPEEYAELVRWSPSELRSANLSPNADKLPTVLLENTHQNYAARRFTSHTKFLEFPLYVVPPEYIS